LRKPLLDVIVASEKRKNTLLLLQDGPKAMEFFLNSLKTTRQALLPQIRILEDHYLITHSYDVYELTTIGKMIVDEMAPLLNIVETLDSDIDYWGNHSLDFIPSHLLKRISKLGHCKSITPPITEMYEISREFQETSKRSNSTFIITAFLHPNFPEIFSELIDNNVTISIIISKELHNKLLMHSNIHSETVFRNKRIHIYVYPEKMNFMSFAYNDYQLMMSLLDNSGNYDNRHLLCSNPEAREWAKEICEHYLKNSSPITEI
jgi:predicted transcriptional regulator